MIMDIRETTKTGPREEFASSETLSLSGFCLDAETAGDLKQFARSGSIVRLQTEFPTYLTEDDDSLLERMGESSAPNVCLIDFDQDRQRAVHTAERIHEKLPNTAIFAVSSEPQPELIIQAMRCGCSEYLIKPMGHEQLLEAMARVVARKREKREHLNGQVLTFVGAKGGCGVTTLATHLGTLLAKSFSRKVLLVDLHPNFGDAALYLGQTKQRYHFYELAESTDRLDSDLLQSFLLHHPSGLDILPAPDASEPSRDFTIEAIGQTIDFLRHRYEFVIVDCPPGLSPQNVELIHRSDQLYLVTVAEVSAVRNVACYLDYLNRAEFAQDRVRVIVNRHLKRGALTDAEIEKAIHRTIYWRVPNEYNQVIKTINGGDPVAHLSDSEVVRNLMAWAGALGGKSEPPAKKKEGRGLLGLLA
jgi:pilus assembly protein CpaE